MGCGASVAQTTPAKNGRQPDSTLDMRVYWDVFHRLDFMSGVIDFVNHTKEEDDVVSYGFAISGSEAVCKESYTSARGFIEHLNGAHGIIQAIQESKPRSDCGGGGGKISPAGLIKRIEASGPSREIQALRSELQARDLGLPFLLFETLEEAALYDARCFSCGEADKPFEPDRSVTVVTHWDVELEDVELWKSSLLGSTEHAQCVRRFALATAAQEPEVMCNVNSLQCVVTFSYTSAQAASDHWHSSRRVAQDACPKAKIRKTEAHAPASYIQILSLLPGDLGDEESCEYWRLVHGSFYRPHQFGVGARTSDDDLSVLHRNAMQMKLLQSLSQADETQTDGFAVPIEDRGLTLQELMKLDCSVREQFGEDYARVDMYSINERIVMPVCTKHQQPYSVVANKGAPLRASHFVTHAWAEHFAEFVEAINSALRPMPREQQSLWICVFAVFQTNDKAAISAQLGLDPRQAPFTRALQCADRFVVVRNRVLNVYTRIWCCWELYCAYAFGFLKSDKLAVTGPNAFASMGLCDVGEAKSSNADDKSSIMRVIEEEAGMRDHINLLIELLQR